MILKRVPMCVAACLFLAFASSGLCQTRAAESLNDGRLWNDMTPQVKGFYLIGYLDAVGFVSVNTTRSPEEFHALHSRFYPSSSGGAQMIDSLNSFYANPQNVLIGIPWAIQLMAAKASGVGAAEIEKRTETLRSAAASPL
jgi:hypothetical protein